MEPNACKRSFILFCVNLCLSARRLNSDSLFKRYILQGKKICIPKMYVCNVCVFIEAQTGIFVNQKEHTGNVVQLPSFLFLFMFYTLNDARSYAISTTQLARFTRI